MNALDERLLEIALAEVFRGPRADLSVRVLEAWHRERSSGRSPGGGSIAPASRRSRDRILALSAAAAIAAGILVFWRLLPARGAEVVATASAEARVFRSREGDPSASKEVRRGDFVASFPSAAAPPLAWGGDAVRCDPATLIRLDDREGAPRLSVLLGAVRLDHREATPRILATDHAVGRLHGPSVVEVRVLPSFQGADDMFTQTVRDRMKGSLPGVAVTALAVLQGSILVEARGESRTVGAGESVAVDASGFQDSAAPGLAAGPEHDLLKRMAGQWTTKVRFRRSPTEAWGEASGTEVRELGCGGQWLFASVRSTGFEGRQQLGYDAGKKKFVATWVDNESPVMTLWEGTFDAKEKVLTLRSEVADPSSGKPVRMRMTYDLSRDDAMVCRGFVRLEGDEFQSLDIAYARSAGPR